MAITRRRKEKCKERSKEIHSEEQGDRENPMHKRRKVEETGEYRTVLRKKVTERREDSGEDSKKETKPKKRKVEEETKDIAKEPYRILGERIYRHEIENIDWDEERRKKKEYLEKEEEMRKKKVRKAMRLETGWQLMQEC